MFMRGWNRSDCGNCMGEWKNIVGNGIRVLNGRMGMNMKILAHSLQGPTRF